MRFPSSDSDTKWPSSIGCRIPSSLRRSLALLVFLPILDGGVIFRTVGVVSAALKNGGDATAPARGRGRREGDTAVTSEEDATSAV